MRELSLLPQACGVHRRSLGPVMRPRDRVSGVENHMPFPRVRWRLRAGLVPPGGRRARPAACNERGWAILVRDEPAQTTGEKQATGAGGCRGGRHPIGGRVNLRPEFPETLRAGLRALAIVRLCWLSSCLAGEGEAIVRKCIEQAKAGEPVAMRLCIERIVPRAGAVARVGVAADPSGGGRRDCLC